MAKISVIIPVYNSEHFLRQCLDSVLRQTLSDIEIICVDDGSSDGSLSILNEYRDMDARVQIIQQNNLYAGVARNNGLQVATAEYVHFLDSDDWIEPSMYELLYETIQREQADICICQHIKFDNETGEETTISHLLEENQYVGTSRFSDNRKFFLYNTVVPWNKLYKTSFLREHNILFQNLICANDRAFYIHVLTKAGKIAILNEHLVHYRINNSGSLVGTKRLRNFQCHFESYERIMEIVNEEPEETKKMLLDVSIRDFVNFYKRAEGELREAVRKQLFEYMIQMPLYLVGDITKYNWYQIYLEIMAYPYESKKVTELQRELNARNNKIKFLRKRIRELETHVDAIYQSKTFRAGKAVFFLPNLVRKGGRKVLRLYAKTRAWLSRNRMKWYLRGIYRVFRFVKVTPQRIRDKKRERAELKEKLKEARPPMDGILKNSRRNPKIVVSLTTYPARIETVYIVLRQMLRQTMKPDHIILYLAESQFPDHKLPYWHKLYRKAGVQFLFCEDLKPHKKYYYAMQQYPDAIVITVDDDLNYRTDLIEVLYKSYSKFPNCVCALRTHEIAFSESGELLPYADWNHHNSEIIEYPSMKLIATGVSGILYPPRCLHPEVFNKISIQKTCLMADDLWLKVMEVLHGTPVVQAEEPKHLKYIDGTQETALWRTNLTENKNDIQLKNILRIYNDYLGKSNTVTGRIMSNQIKTG